MVSPLQFDPWLKETLLRRTGSTSGEGAPEEVGAQEIPVIARLRRPEVDVPGLAIVARYGPIVTGRTSLSRVVDVRRHANIVSLKGSRPYEASLDRSVPDIGASAQQLQAAVGLPGLSGRGTVIGFPDWGVDFGHRSLRDAPPANASAVGSPPGGRTRLMALWDQRGPQNEHSPAPFGYGRAFARREIDAALAQPDPYAALAYDPALGDRSRSGTHGTHVMDIAAGNGRAIGSCPGVAPGADLVFVHLRGEDTHPEDNLGDSVRLLEAIKFIIDTAGDRPVAVNCSLGRTGGPHDASPLLVQALDALVEEAPGRAVVMSTGNYYDADLHASGRVENGGAVELPWRVATRHDEFAEFEAWYPGKDRLRLVVIDPSGRRVSAELSEDRIVRQGDRTIATVYQRAADPNNGMNQAEVFLWPDAPIGTWTVRFEGVSVRDGSFDAWLERDDPPFQSRFARSVASSATTTNSICNGRNTISVGAFDARSSRHGVVSFSSAGPTRDGRPVPVISAPGASIRAARSTVMSDGRREMDGLTVKSGTSMASPHVAGVVALCAEAASPRRLSASELRQVLTRTAVRNPPSSDTDAFRYGTGRVNAAAAVAAARRLRDEIRVGVPGEVGERAQEEVPEELSAYLEQRSLSLFEALTGAGGPAVKEHAGRFFEVVATERPSDGSGAHALVLVADEREGGEDERVVARRRGVTM